MGSRVVRIELPEALATSARQVGQARASRAERNGWTRNVHTTASNFERHIQAAGSEAAVALFTGGEWVDDLNAFRTRPDVEPDLEVRRIAKRWWRLPVYRDDDKTRKFVLVAGEIPTFYILGWIGGEEAVRVGAWADQHNTGVGAWFVSQSDLRAPAELLPQLAL